MIIKHLRNGKYFNTQTGQWQVYEFDADLIMIDLKGANLEWANLKGTNLEGCELC